MYRLIHAVTWCLIPVATALGGQASQSPPGAPVIPPDARYACPMETHPDESDPARRGPYFSAEDGRCPWCGMALKPLDELAWVQVRRAAGGAEVAYTCPDHQHVFYKGAAGAAHGGAGVGGRESSPGVREAGPGVSPVNCPRCGRTLQPFQVMYTCPDPRHAVRISTRPGTCPECGRRLTPYRGMWLSPEMADRNVPPHPAPARLAAFRCPTHPLAHSARPAQCPICAADMVAAEPTAQPAGVPDRPAGGFVCPMHPDRTSARPGTCPTCGMQLVSAAAVPRPTSAPAAIAVHVDYLMEHYLALQERFASDSTRDAALHALGLVGAADEILRHAQDPGAGLPPAFFEAVDALRRAASKTTGSDLEADRVTFVALSGAMRQVIEHVRPSVERYPKLYLFHCPMTKGDWIQASPAIANPFYGFAMLRCGEPTGVK